MLKPQGYAFEMLDGKIKEWDTFTCNHCQRVIRYQKRVEAEQLGGHCLVCDAMICDRCVGKGCTPFLKKIEEMEEREIARRSYEQT